jgi:uncharacterized protein
MSIALTVAVMSALAAGAFVQRISGVGFSLIVAPLLALVSGPHEGVALTNLLTIVVALTALATSIRHVDKAKSTILVPTGLIGVVPGVFLFHLLPTRALQVSVGAVIGLGLIAIIAAPRIRLQPRLAITICAGLVSGFTTTVAGAGGPALTVYAVVTGWSQPEFAATGQIAYATQAMAALAIRGFPHFSLGWIGIAVTATLCGLVAGVFVAGRISVALARRAAVTLAVLATLATAIKGFYS